MVYVSTWGRTPSFCQDIFGPAVMMAAGRGYVNPDLEQIPELDAFLHPEMHTFKPPAVDAFDVETLPAEIPEIPFEALQKRQLYLLLAAGAVWSAFGVAWSALTPLYGILYGASGAAAYGLFRLGMNRLLASCCAFLFIISPIQLRNLVRLRDYSKAPFMLAAIFLIGLLLKKDMKGPARVACAAACGAAVGLGIGFRFDVFITIGAFVPVILFLVPGKTTGSLLFRPVALAAFALAFLGAGWPVLSQLGEHGDKCHPAIMGFAQIYDERLGVDAHYQLAHRYLDTEPIAMIHAHAAAQEQAGLPVRIETPEYERLGDTFYPRLIKTFPADMAVRAYAAVLRTLDELRAGPGNAVPDGVANRFATTVFTWRAMLIDTVFSHSRYAAAAALILLAAYNFRIGLGALFLLLFFGGYTCNQFATRNYFQFEFFSIWASGFLVMSVWRALRAVFPFSARSSVQPAPEAGGEQNETKPKAILFPGLARAILFIIITAAGLSGLLWSLRWYQNDRVHALFDGYAAAEREPLPIRQLVGEEGRVRFTSPAIPTLAVIPPAHGQLEFHYDFLAAEIDTSGKDVHVVADYDGDAWDSELSWDVVLPQNPSNDPQEETVTRLYFPVYALNALVFDFSWSAFTGLELMPEDADRLKGLYRIRHPRDLPFMITATLPPDWEQLPHYQQFTR